MLVALVIGIRIFGKRDLGNLNLVDIVMVLLLGNAVQNAITVGSGKLAVGLVSAGVLLLADRLLGIVYVRSPWLEIRLSGGPTILYDHGKLNRLALRREGLTEEDLLAAARSTGLSELAKVRLAVLEEDGTISIVPEENED